MTILARKYTIVLFTRKDELDKNKKDVDEFVKSLPSNDYRRAIITQCSGRITAFNNGDSFEGKMAPVNDFPKIVDKMLAENNNRCCTSECFKKAEEAMNKEILQEKERLLKEKESEVERMKKQYEEKMAEYMYVLKDSYDKMIYMKTKRFQYNLLHTQEKYEKIISVVMRRDLKLRR